MMNRRLSVRVIRHASRLLPELGRGVHRRGPTATCSSSNPFEALRGREGRNRAGRGWPGVYLPAILTAACVALMEVATPEGAVNDGTSERPEVSPVKRKRKRLVFRGTGTEDEVAPRAVWSILLKFSLEGYINSAEAYRLERRQILTSICRRKALVARTFFVLLEMRVHVGHILVAPTSSASHGVCHHLHDSPSCLRTKRRRPRHLLRPALSKSNTTFFHCSTSVFSTVLSSTAMSPHSLRT